MNSVIGFLSRSHGYKVLESLIQSKKYKILKIYTHKLNPKSQDPNQSIRSDFHLFEKLCLENKIPLITIDSKKERIGELPICDFVIEVSWRYYIPKESIKNVKIGAVGIHRGKLPDYAGAEPIKQALEHNEKEIIVSAHNLDAEIDQGNVFATESFPVDYDSKFSLEENIQRIREEITFIFPKLTYKTFSLLINS